MAKESKEIYYVSINNSHDLRRGILETSKEVIEGLQGFERYKKTRAEKIKTMENLIMQIREINELATKVKIDMPKIKLPQIKKPEPKKEEKPAGKKEAKKDPKEIELPPKKQFEHESADELQKLESAIAEIEARLKDLS